jgi:hypothetical protein
MLKKSKISGVQMLSDEWKSTRLAKFTSSDKDRCFGAGALRYVREKVGEEMTGKSAKTDIDTDATRWGVFHEADAITKFGNKMGLSFLVTQQFVCDKDSRFGCTPDGLIVVRESPDETEYEVETVEVKCPPTFANYIELFECETPMDLKKANSTYYWQCLDQMLLCESLNHHFVVYHPDFRCGNMKILSFATNYSITTPKGKEFPIFNDMKLLKERNAWLENEFDRIRTKMMVVPNI